MATGNVHASFTAEKGGSLASPPSGPLDAHPCASGLYGRRQHDYAVGPWYAICNRCSEVVTLGAKVNEE